MSLILRLGLILLLVNPARAQNGEEGKYTHILSWGPWNGSLENKDLPLVLLDNRSIGSALDANNKLDTLDVGPKDKIKIQIPTAVDLSAYGHRPIYSFSNFLSIWLKKGVHLYFFQGSKELKLHTLTWSDYRDENGAWKDDLTTAHLVLDNKDIGQVDVALKKLQRMTWKNNALLQLYFPYANEPQPMLLIPQGLNDVLEALSKSGRVLVEEIPYNLSKGDSTP